VGSLHSLFPDFLLSGLCRDRVKKKKNSDVEIHQSPILLRNSDFEISDFQRMEMVLCCNLNSA
jgi:hypothetical protein